MTSSFDSVSSALACAAVALRASTGSARFDLESLEESILAMDVENAAGSLRFRARRGLSVVMEWEDEDTEECADEAREGELSVGLAERGGEEAEAEAEEARSKAVNLSFWSSSSSLASFVDEEGLL